MAVPVLETPGTVVTGTGTTLDPPYPATVNAGDGLFLAYVNGSSTDPMSIEAGWTAVAGSSFATGTGALNVYKKDTVTGSESGTVALTGLLSGDSHIARIYRTSGGSETEGLDTGNGSSKTVSHSPCTTTGTDRLVINFMGINDDEAASSYTGETGGDFTLQYDDVYTGGDDAGLSVQTAPLTGSGTISGGSWTYGGATEQWGDISFAVYALTPATWDQDSYRLRDDDGTETTATWLAAANTAVTNMGVGSNFRVRFLVQETAGSDQSETPDFQLMYRHKPAAGSFGSWLNVESFSNTTEPIRAANSANYAAGVATQQLGSGTFNDGEITEGAGLITSKITATAGSDEIEVEFCVFLNPHATTTPCGIGDQIELRLQVDPDAGGYVDLDSYTNTAAITAASQSWEQLAYRFRNDDDTLAAATWMAAINTQPADVALDTNFRIRFVYKNTVAMAQSVGPIPRIRLQYRVNLGAWTTPGNNGTTVLPFRVANSIHYIDSADNTQRVGSGTFVEGTADNAVPTAVFGTSQEGIGEFEHEICFICDSSNTTPAAAGDDFEIRGQISWDSGSNYLDFETYTNTASVSVAAGSTTYEGTGTATVTAAMAADGTRTVGAAAGTATTSVDMAADATIYAQGDATAAITVDASGAATRTVPAAGTATTSVLMSADATRTVGQATGTVVLAVDASADATRTVGQATGTASLSVNMTGAASVAAAASATASLAILAAADATRTVGAASGTIVISADMAADASRVVGAASGTASTSILASADATRYAAGTATAAFDIDMAADATVTGGTVFEGTGTAAFVVNASADATRSTAGAGTSAFDVDMAADATRTVGAATGTAALDVDMAADATREVGAATGTAAFEIDASADATRFGEGSGTAAFDVDASGAATREVGAATGTAAIEVDISADATRSVPGAGTAAFDVDMSGDATIEGAGTVFEATATATVEITAIGLATRAVGPGTGTIFFEIGMSGNATGGQDDARQPGASWPAPSGYYKRPKKPVREEVIEAAEQVVEIAARSDYKISPKQLGRMTQALVTRRKKIPDAGLLAVQEEIDRLQALIIDEAARKAIEKEAAQLAFLMAYQAAAQALDDEEALFLMAAI